MVKVKTIGMIADNKKSNPTVVAHAELPNGYLHTVSEDGKTVAPVAGSNATSQTVNLSIALNTQLGDDLYVKDYKIASGDNVNSFLLKEWDGQELTVTEDNITYASGENYASLTKYVAGTTPTAATLMIADTNGKFAVANATVAGYHKVYFKVMEKVQFGGNAVDLKICLN